MRSSDGDEINRIKKKEEILIVEERRDKMIMWTNSQGCIKSLPPVGSLSSLLEEEYQFGIGSGNIKDVGKKIKWKKGRNILLLLMLRLL